MNDWLNRFRQTKAYDRLIAVPLILWFGRGAWEDFKALAPHIPLMRSGQETTFGALQYLAVMASAMFCLVLIVLLIFRTMPRARASGILPRAMAVIGTFLATGFVYAPPVPLSPAMAIVSVVLILISAVLGMVVINRLGSSFAIMPEARALVTSGPYRIVRHPLYVVEAIGVTSLLIQRFGWMALGLYAGFLAAQIVRAHYEEQVLSATFPEYRDYAAKTARFIPFIW